MVQQTAWYFMFLNVRDGHPSCLSQDAIQYAEMVRCYRAKALQYSTSAASYSAVAVGIVHGPSTGNVFAADTQLDEPITLSRYR